MSDNPATFLYSHQPLTEEDRRRLEETLRQGDRLQVPFAVDSGAKFTTVVADEALRQCFDTLLVLLRLSDEERLFVRTALVEPDGTDFWEVFADFLLDRNRNWSAAAGSAP